MQSSLDSVFIIAAGRIKSYEKAILVAESDYAKGELETARAEYINALRFKPNQPDALAKINEINLKLGIAT